MTLPNFLGIGAPRAGSTLLYRLLKSHPDVHVPENRKEIHFFDWYYNKGLDWYKSFFKECLSGEITPIYMVDEKIPELIKKDLPRIKFLVILRNPVDRFFSDYKYKISTKNVNINSLLKPSSDAYQKSFYAKQLKHWFKYFNREQFFILIFEEVISEPDKTIEQLADFLGVDKEGFDKSVFSHKVNAAYEPRFKALYKSGFKIKNYFLRKDWDFLYKIITKTKPLFQKTGKKQKEKLSPEMREKLYNIYKKDIEELEKLLNRDLKVWKK